MFKSLKDLLYITEYLLDGPNGEIKTLEVSESKRDVFVKLSTNIERGAIYDNHAMTVLKASSYEFRNGVNGLLINEYWNLKRASPRKLERVETPGNFNSEQTLLDVLNHINENRELIRYDRESKSRILYHNYKLHISPVFVNEFFGNMSPAVRKSWLENRFIVSHKEMVDGSYRNMDTKGVRVNKGTEHPRFIIVDQGFIKKHKFEFNNQFEKQKVHI